MSESMKQAGGGRTAPAGTTSGRLFVLGESCFLADASLVAFSHYRAVHWSAEKAAAGC